MPVTPKEPEPIQPQQEIQQPAEPEPIKTADQTLNNASDNLANFLNDVTADAKLSADTIVSPEGIAEVKLPATPAAGKREPLTTEKATENAQTFIELRDAVQSIGIALYADGELSQCEKYGYEDWQKKKLIKAWSPIFQKSGREMSPWFAVASAEIVSTGPLIALMVENRKYRKKLEAATAQIQELTRKMQAERSSREGKTSDAIVVPEAPAATTRRDNVRAWELDDRGYFKYGPTGSSSTYVKEADRKQRPELPQDYEALVKWNGKEKIDQIFKLS